MVFKKKKKEMSGHDITIGGLLKITRVLDEKLSEMGLCSHQICTIGMFLMNANSMGDNVRGIGVGISEVSGEDMKEILKKIVGRFSEEEE